MERRINIGNPVLIITFSLVLILTGACHKGKNSYIFETAVVKKGSIINTISATGTVEADTTVALGTQVSGVIKRIYVDFNSNVHKGQLLAVLDTIPLLTQLQQAQASLEDAKSQVGYQKATYERYVALMEKKLVARADFDLVKYNYDNAQANLKTAQAGFDKAKVNLSYALIYSPISGVVLNRAVDQGQTVAASFNTPNLFTIGSDLRRMQVQANVDEADIGQVKLGQSVTFTVDAYPSDTFTGDVSQIRLQPVVTSNVVTYTVIVDAPNPDVKLMPGMTATITVLVQKVDSVLVIPGKALRFTPDPTWLAEYTKNNPYPRRPDSTAIRQSGAGDRQRTERPAGQSEQGGFQAGSRTGKKPVLVWVKSGDKIHRARLVTGAVDGTNAEVKWGLKEGDEVITAMSQPGKSGSSAAAPATATSPFMPQRRPASTPTRR